MQSIIVGALVGVMVYIALLIAPTGGYDARSYCQANLVEAMTTAQRDALIEQGWYGDPNDHMEALYPPDC